MARNTASNPAEHLGRGRVPDWFVHRYKLSLDGTASAANIGTASDVGVDPAITSIPYTTVGTDAVCELPTRPAWSSGCEAMLFYVQISGTSATLIDLEFYEAKYGSTDAIEEWRLIRTHTDCGDGDVIGVETDGGRIFARVAGITNPDGSATLHLECRKAHHSTPAVSGGGIGGGGGGGLNIDETVEALGTYWWNFTDSAWRRTPLSKVDNAVDAYGLNVGSKAQASQPTDVQAGDFVHNLATLSGAQVMGVYHEQTDNLEEARIERHGDRTTLWGTQVGGYASDPRPALTVNQDFAVQWMTRSGAAASAGYDLANDLLRELPVLIVDSSAGTTGQVTGGRHDATIPAAVGTDGDYQMHWVTANGGQVVGGYDAANTTSRNLPLENTNDAASGVGLPVGGVVDTTAPTAAADGDFMPIWMSPEGAPVVAGHHQAGNVPVNLPVEETDTAHSSFGVAVAGFASTAVPGAVSADGEAQMPWVSRSGATVVAGYDVTNTTPRNLPVENQDDAVGGTGVPWLGRADTTIPAAVSTDGDAVAPWMSTAGAQIVGGYNLTTTTPWYLPIEVHDEAANTAALMTGGLAQNVAPAVVSADGDFVRDWKSQQGASVVAGYDTANTLVRALPVEQTNAATQGYGVPIGGMVDTTIPGACGDGDYSSIWLDIYGAQVLAGYDAGNTTSRTLPVEIGDGAASDIGVSIGGVCTSTSPPPVVDTTGDFACLTMDMNRRLWVTCQGLLDLDDAIEDHDATLSDVAILRVGGQAHSGTPPAVANLDNCRFAFDLNQSAKTHLTNALDATNDSIESYNKPPDGVTSTSTAISNAAATAISASVSTCQRVHIQNRVGNGPIAIGDSGIAGVNEGIILQAGASLTMEIDDPSKVYAWATNLNDPLDVLVETRA